MSDIIGQRRGEVDGRLSDLVESRGGFSTSLSYQDRQRLRAVVKKVHMKFYPNDMITDFEADKMIDAIAPATAEYLIRKHVFSEGERRSYGK